MGAEYATFEGKDFSVESNSHTAEQMAASFGQKPAETAPETAPKAVPQADVAGEDAEDQEAPETAPEGKEEGGKGKHKPIQPRINQLVREKREAEERAKQIEARYQAELAEIRAKLPKEAAPEPVKAEAGEGKPRPKLDEFESIEDHAEAVANWVADRREEQMKKAQEEQRAAAKRQESEAEYEKRFTTFRDSFVAKMEEHPDLKDAEVTQWVPLRHMADQSPANVTQQNFIAQQFIDREKGLDLLLYFKDNPLEARRISALQRPVDILVELGIIEKGLGTGNPTASVPQQPQVSKAAPPARSVTGGPPITSAGPSADDSDDDYIRKRRAQELKKRR